MKKLLLSLPFLLVLLHLTYINDGPNQWSQLVGNTGILWTVAVDPVNTNNIYAGSNSQGVWKTTNGGLNWALSNSGLTNLVVQYIAIAKTSPNIVYCGVGGTVSSGVYKSTDYGATWTLSSSGMTQNPPSVQWLAVSPTNANVVIAAVWDGSTVQNAVDGVYKTTNGGANWFVANTGMTLCKNILTIIYNPLNPNTVYAGTSFQQNPQTGPSYIYKSLDGGGNWVSFSNGLPTATTDLNAIRAMSISTSDTNVVLAGSFMNTTTGGAFITTNGGALWVKKHNGLPSTQYTLIRGCFIRTGSSTDMYVGLDRGASGTNVRGIWRTTDQGNTWVDFTGGPFTNNFIVRQITMRTTPDSTLYACGADSTTAGQGVFAYTFIPVGIPNHNGNVPKDFALYQNFPNPFNPSTVIAYDIPKESFVKITVYDISGKEVKTLVNETMRAGSHNVTFGASGLSSGIYFYKITAGGFVKTLKMALIK